MVLLPNNRFELDPQNKKNQENQVQMFVNMCADLARNQKHVAPPAGADGVGKVMLIVNQDTASRSAVANPDAVLAGDCKPFKNNNLFTPKGNAAMQELEAIIAELADKEGGDDKKLKKLVLTCHGENGYLNIETKTGQVIPLHATSVAEVASKYMEKDGELVLAICFVAPTKYGVYKDASGQEVETDPYQGIRNREKLSKIADTQDLYIKFSGDDFWHVGGKRGHINSYATSDIWCALPNGEIIKDSSVYVEKVRREQDFKAHPITKFWCPEPSYNYKTYTQKNKNEN